MHETTSWTLIRSAADGEPTARAEFARHYLPVVRDYLRARWLHRLSADEIEDAVQEVFLECLKDEGVLDRALDIEQRGFRGFLYGVARNVARRVEERGARRLDGSGPASFHGDEHCADDASLSRVFDRSWARSVMREAGDLQARRARAAGEEARRRVELLRLRFREGLGMQAIAKLWQVDPAALHRQYAVSRKEFERALFEVVCARQGGSQALARATCLELLALLE